MIPYDLDPSLHTAEPASKMLDDGFSPPQQPVGQKEQLSEAERVSAESALAPKSPF
jgi:hypothetical protein